MTIHEQVKKVLTEHKNKIELFQWAVINGVSSLIYSEYIRRIQQRLQPVEAVLVPEMKLVRNLLKADGPFLNKISEEMINYIRSHPIFNKFIGAPELVIFDIDHIEILKTVFDLYIIPNIERRIPETIEMKFSLKDEKNQYFIQDREITLFDGLGISNNMYCFIYHQTMLQLLMLLPTMKKEIIVPKDNMNILITEDEILSIGHVQAVSPIHFDREIIENSTVDSLLSFVTSSTFNRCDQGENISQNKDGKTHIYHVSTGAFNQAALTTLNGIEKEEEG